MAKKPPPFTSGFRSYALSDQGVRSNNEDLVYNDDARGIYFVVDGMGGHAAGEQAAQIAGERLKGRLERATGTPQQRIREAIALANNAIFEAAEQHPGWNGMACVLTVALVSSDTATIGHVGDSRLYKIRGASLDKITRDHSPVGELEDSQQLSEAEAMAHPRRNEVYRDVGSTLHDPNDSDFIDIYEVPAEPDSALLICSDGLTDAVPLAEIRGILGENARDPAAAVKSLINKAKRMEGKDNISVVLVEGPAFGSAKRPAIQPQEVTTTSSVPVPEAAVQPPLLMEAHRPLWRRMVWPILWMAFGAVLLFGLQQAIRYRLQALPTVPANGGKAPVTIRVDARKAGAQPTIAAALAIAAEGDTIELTPGVYDEPVRIDRNNILLDGSGALLRLKPTSEGSDALMISGATGVRIQNLRIAGDADGNLLTGIRMMDSQVSLRNVHVLDAAAAGVETGGTSTLQMEGSSVRDCSGPGLLLRGTAAAAVKYSAIVGNGREPGDREPGILRESPQPAVLVGNTIANNGGPAIMQPDLPSQDVLAQNLFSLDGRKGKLDDIRVMPKRVHK